MQRETKEEKIDRWSRGEPDGIAVVVRQSGKVLGIGKDLDTALQYAREGDGHCAYCQCGRDERMWVGYRLHPYAVSILCDGVDRTVREERLTWCEAEGRLRWVPWPECTACDGNGRLDGGARCERCDSGMLEDPEDEVPEPSWYVAPPPAGVVWEGKISPCLARHQQVMKELRSQ
ncbi:MAG TPA: hypothetical protein VJT85_00110 [Gemmatimonadaceae bacterium]|nr:hypothetical protein [Gemmatimonadaceae bacterium]